MEMQMAKPWKSTCLVPFSCNACDETNKSDLTLGLGPAGNTELFDEKKEVIGADQPMEIASAVMESVWASSIILWNLHCICVSYYYEWWNCTYSSVSRTQRRSNSSRERDRQENSHKIKALACSVLILDVITMSTNTTKKMLVEFCDDDAVLLLEEPKRIHPGGESEEKHW